jgi:flagellum-specific ATP synthase
MREIVSPRHLELAGQVRTILAPHKEAEDLINIGAYSKGSNPNIDYAITRIDAINNFLKQGMTESTPLKQTIEQLGELLSGRKDEAPQRRDRRGEDLDRK